jgi:glutaredoxin 3
VRASDAAAQQPRRRAGTLAEGPVEVDKLIAAHKVVVFSKTYCPYCCAVKELLDSLGVQYALVELDTRDDGPLLQQRMAAISKVQTVPNVFLGGEFLADSSGTRRLFKEGKLQELLRQHGVAFSEPASA